MSVSKNSFFSLCFLALGLLCFIAPEAVGGPKRDCISSSLEKKLSAEVSESSNPMDIKMIEAQKLSAEELAVVNEKTAAFQKNINACLSTKRGRGIAERFKDKQYWRNIRDMTVMNILSQEIADLGMYSISYPSGTMANDPYILYTDLINDAIWSGPSNLVMSLGPVLVNGKSQVIALGVNALLADMVGFPKRLVDHAVYKEGLKKTRSDLSSEQIDEAAQKRLNTLLVWQAVPSTLINLTVFEVMAGTSCLIPGAQWIRSRGPGGKMIFSLVAQNLNVHSNNYWKRLFIPSLPEKDK